MKFKRKYFKILTLFFLFFISCNKEQNDAFYELRYNLPDYFKEYDYKSYLKENNISNFGSHISGEYASYKDSGNTTCEYVTAS